MCEAKPGPRCSADAQRTLEKAKINTRKAQTIFAEKNRAYVAARNNQLQVNTPRTTEAVMVLTQDFLLAKSNMEAAETVQYEKQLEYNSTPAGMEELSKRSDFRSQMELKAANEYRELQRMLVLHLKSFNTLETKIQFVTNTRNMLNKEVFKLHQEMVNNHGEHENKESYHLKLTADYLKLAISDLDEVALALQPTR